MNGLSFYVSDTITKSVLLQDKIVYKTESTPYLVLKELKGIFAKYNLVNEPFEEVCLTHKNQLFCLVPKPLFDKEELPNYLKFNTKILANDEIVFDELKNQDIICVYVPYTNINNYLFDCFGEFEFKHHSVALLLALLHQKSNKTICYVHVDHHTMELAVMDQRKLVLYNQFKYKTKEDFLYYVLFTYEQLQLDTEHVKLKLFGTINEDDDIYEICYQYIKKVAVFVPKNASPHWSKTDETSLDLTLLGNK